MTPLTHAAVGAVIYRQLGKGRRVRWAWLLALPLAFLSHFALDAIPHFEGMAGLSPSRNNAAFFAAVGLAGFALVWLVARGNRESDRIWMVLCLWIALGSYSFSWLRVLTAALALGYVGWRTRRWADVACTAAGMAAMFPDLIPASFHRLASLHDFLHYHTSLAVRFYLAYSHLPYSYEWTAQLHDPYILLGYALEALIEGGIFCGALYLLFRKEPAAVCAKNTISESLAASAKT